MTKLLDDLAARAKVTWTGYQLKAFESAAQQLTQQRLCLYFPTGKGKTFTSLACMIQWEQDEVLVLCPPATHQQWVGVGLQLGIKVTPMSHAKFRMADTKVARTQALIVDEMHLLGGHSGKGWKKLDRMATGLQAPIILASATPNYNDADRVYCIQHVLDPSSCRGGFLEFLYQHCTTEQNNFGRMPIVTGFQRFPGAAEYLESLPKVEYLPDELVYKIQDIVIPEKIFSEVDEFGYDARRHKMIGSIIEEKHMRIHQSLVTTRDEIEPVVYRAVRDLMSVAAGPVLIFSNHATVARAMEKTLAAASWRVALVDGSTPVKKKEARVAAFRDGVLDVLVGTASLATGVDGLDKMCDTLIILDDTDDDSLRRQLVGRIMPRGLGGEASKKQVFRLLLSP